MKHKLTFKEFMENSWAIWAILIGYGSLFFLMPTGLEMGVAGDFMFLYLPTIFVIGLVLNIKKNKKNKTKFYKDWKFWLWCIPLIFLIGFCTYVCLFNYLVNGFI